jgi:RES domain-containing protein
MTPPLARTAWPRSVRIIPSRFPPVQIFERVADPADLDAVIAIESLTNDRLRDEVGELERVPPGERVVGPGAGYVMASFTHLPPPGQGGRFNDATFGAYYAASDRATAIAETVHHRERFLRASREPAQEVDMRVLVARVDADLHDVREAEDPRIHDPADHRAGRALAARLRSAGSWGVLYRSVRRPGGECVALFRPRAVQRCHQAGHLAYLWDGERIAHVVEKRLVR